MAKEFSFADLNKEMSKHSTYGETLDKSTISEIDHYIPTGNFHLNACLTGSLFGLLLAYVIKTYALANSSIESGYERLSLALDDSSKILGSTGWHMLRKIHVPLLKTSILTSILLFK